MNKKQIQEELNKGNKVQHSSFTDGEFIYQVGNMIFTEEGYSITREEFWKYRQHIGFNKNWFIFEKNVTRKDLLSLNFEETVGQVFMLQISNIDFIENIPEVKYLSVTLDEEVTLCSIDFLDQYGNFLSEIKEGLTTKVKLIKLIDSFKQL